MTKYLMNSSILPNDGLYEMKTVSEEEVRTWVKKGEIPVSAIGHSGTAEVAGRVVARDTEGGEVDEGKD